MRQFPITIAFSATMLLLASSCDSKIGDGSTALQETYYFSLADYFHQEATRLQQHNPEIIKTVAKDGTEEQKAVRVADWKKEFTLFIDADINKPAWQNSYRVSRDGLTVTYTSIDSTLRTKEIRVEKSNAGTVTQIHVTNQVRNMLYTTKEQLDYYVDSLYRITKQQQVRVIGKSHYTVTGEWL
ncbi:hypothetical protein [Parapedobacter sp. 10938]|uniref:hypothetical protein n=1 Tax=Parapedobacter flavus TaxID=3110225 RepID=UPI002DBFEA84|nr:hypothetical protein [Parapedobacter sp. 10938]MEC3880414.1 hypothetical protein [Parapedobacter sp. 10938]